MGNEKGYKIKKCSVCEKEYRRLWSMKCYSCYVKSKKMMYKGRTPYTLKEALAKEYVIKVYSKKGTGIYGVISVPSVLAGYKVKISLVKENEKKE